MRLTSRPRAKGATLFLGAARSRKSEPMGSPKRYSPQVPRLGALGCQMRHESYRTLSRPTSCLALTFQSRGDTDSWKIRNHHQHTSMATSDSWLEVLCRSDAGLALFQDSPLQSLKSSYPPASVNSARGLPELLPCWRSFGFTTPGMADVAPFFAVYAPRS